MVMESPIKAQVYWERQLTQLTVLFFLVDVMVSSISRVGWRRWHCCASPFQEQAVTPVVVKILFLLPVVMTTVAEHLCDA